MERWGTNMKKAMIGVSIVVMLFSTAHGATVYKWVDKDGVVYFSDDYSKIPAQYRDRIKTEETGEPQRVETPAPVSGSPQKTEQVRTVDAYGRGEDYWRARVMPWKKQLKEATENYESTNRKMNERLEDQSGKFLSSTQWNMNREGNRQLTEERAKYEAQMKEANEMLAKIAKEAEEAKADPQWLK
jgi:hypothetical protein